MTTIHNINDNKIKKKNKLILLVDEYYYQCETPPMIAQL